jgi:hypothetical protein
MSPRSTFIREMADDSQTAIITSTMVKSENLISYHVLRVPKIDLQQKNSTHWHPIGIVGK